MKKSMIALIAGAGALAAGYAIAGEKGDYGDWEAKLEARFAEVDTDGSGNISREEYLAYKAAKAEKAWDDHAEFVGDDGEASLEEAKAYHKAKMKKHHEEMGGDDGGEE